MSRTSFFLYIFASFVACFADIVAVGLMSTSSSQYTMYMAQLVIMGISSFIFLVGIYATVIHFPVYYPVRMNLFGPVNYIRATDKYGDCVVHQVDGNTNYVMHEMTFEDVYKKHISKTTGKSRSIPVVEGSEAVKSHTLSSLLDRLRLSIDKDAILEGFCYCLGFAFIATNTGIAALRIFRIFRFLGYLKVGLSE